MKFILSLFSFILCSTIISAQMPGGGMGARMGGAGRMNVGHFYGKIVDSKTGKGIGAVTLQLTGNKFDTTTKQMKQAILKTILSEKNGDFSMDNLPVLGNFKLTITRVSYKPITQQLSFGIKMPQAGQTPDMQQMLAMVDKDLGNIKMEQDVTALGDVTVTSSRPAFEMGVDRKIFNVDKNIVSSGQTATELMKTIPSLSVDIDGNVTLRNAAPTIFVDGRPTTLTLDQIPSDIIDKVEIITNPSAKFDASGGNAGILNIVLKKNKKNGYNGGIRAGVDSRGKINSGIDFNFRQNKINFFGSANYNQRKSIPYNQTTKTVTMGTDTYKTYSHDSATNEGYFSFYRAGMDYFIDNRNTITVSGNFHKGHFDNNDPQLIDSTLNAGSTITSNKNSISNTDFQNAGAQLSFKHNFAKNGHDLNFDFNYNSSSPNSISNITYPAYIQKSNSTGYNHFFTFQTDYENQLTDNTKFEAGARGAIRDFRSDNDQYINNVLNNTISSHYSFTDRVYAGYATYSIKAKKWNYQLGLRAESSNYNGMLDGNDSSKIKVNYPISLFPSVFITYKLNSKQDFQLNYSRRVNRPNFFQLLPVYNFTDPQNPSVGNTSLNPEFTNSFEFSYSNSYIKGSNLLITAYFKGTSNLITQYAYKDINKSIQGATDSLYYISYINANNSIAYGLEVTNKTQLTNWWDVTANINFFDSKLSATIPGQNIDNSLLSWFGKLNSNMKIAKGLTLQLTGEWTSKILVPKGGGGGGMGRGGGPFGGGSQNLAQGYIEPRYWDIDVAIKKEWTWKSGESFSINLSSNDIFRTHTKTYTAFTGFEQQTDRMRDPQVCRLNLTYRFGKVDVSLFKRKNTKADNGAGMDMMQ